MITLNTGQPGAGKTLYTLYSVQSQAEKEGRQVYYNGIPDLKVPGWIELDKPEDWYKLPPGSIVVLDECQRLFRPRGNGAAVPEYVAKLETHRHQGLDLFLITQHPMLVDNNVRRLVGRHHHVQRSFGMQRATVHEFPDLRSDPEKNRRGSIRHDFRYPKHVYNWYKSAEVHTVKRHLPMRFWFLVLLPFLLAGAFYYLYHWWDKQVHPVTDGRGAVATQPAGTGNPLPSSQRVDQQPVSTGKYMSKQEFYERQVPRVAGLYHTAPMFDSIMQPKSAPQPKMCISSPKKCICYTDQATRLDMDDTMCRQFAENGYYDVTKPRQDEGQQFNRNQQAQAVLPDNNPPRI